MIFHRTEKSFKMKITLLVILLSLSFCFSSEMLPEEENQLYASVHDLKTLQEHFVNFLQETQLCNFTQLQNFDVEDSEDGFRFLKVMLTEFSHQRHSFERYVSSNQVTRCFTTARAILQFYLEQQMAAKIFV